MANQSKEEYPMGRPWGWGKERASIVLGPDVSQSLTLGGSRSLHSGLGENARTRARMLNMGEPGFQAQGQGVSVTAQEY